MIDDVTCPKCNAPMIMQFASRGKTAGQSFWGCSRFPACRGNRNSDGVAPAGRTPRKKTAAAKPPAGRAARGRALSSGDLLMSSANTFGPGKLVGRDGDALVLEYFDTPGQTAEKRYRESVPRASLKRLALSPELRVFWQNKADRWRSGRVIETNEHGDIYVKGHEWEGHLSESQIFVRWDQPLNDPVGFGAAGMLESPLLADMRRPFLQGVLRQRSASHGMRAALSSCIELHEHQVETAWRVLQDPVQRYLLADEVGLGKTIEAGIVIRQMLLDNPKLSVQLILPPFLVDQWKRELESKFRVQDFPRAAIRFGRDDQPATWSPADLVVVDEAHNLARLSTNRDPNLAARFTKMAETAIASPRLLMLSATPALHNERAFLAMLKLLDPAVYQSTTVAELRERLEARAGLGRLFLGLQPGLPGVLLNSRLNEIAVAFPDDPEVTTLSTAGLTAVAAKDNAALVNAVTALRTHIAEVYRVHRRMLRTRRTAALAGSFRVTGRDVPLPLTLKGGLSTDVNNVLDQWRQQVLGEVEGDPAGLRDAGRSLAAATALTLDPASLVQWAESRVSLSDGEQTALDQISADLRLTDRRKTVSRPLADALSYLFDAKQRVVVFCPTTAMAAEVASELRRILSAETVLQHLATDPPEFTEKSVRTFEETRRAAVLVADSSAEEGRNLQFADLLIHVGVPASANRLEQRIGRCDRWDPNPTGEHWRSYVVRERDDNTFAQAWHRILLEGFGVFGTSVASLQQAVDDATDTAWVILMERGPGGAVEAIHAVQAALAAEVEKVREQDALDSLESTSDERSIFRRMQEVEAEAEDFAALTDSLLSKHGAPGNLRFEAVGHPINDVGSYEVVGKLPGKNAQIPLVPAWRLVRDFLPLREHRGTFVRTVATKRDDVHLYRYGDPFIDSVSDFLTNDDRGRAFGMWRWLPTWSRTETVVYRFDYAIEANPLEVPSSDDPRSKLAALPVDQGLDRLYLARRADGIFPPLIVTVWMDSKGKELTSKAHLQALGAPYAKPGVEAGGDYALNRTRIEHAYEIVPQETWAAAWRRSEKAAQKLVRGSAETLAAIDSAAAIAAQDAATRLGQLRLRAARSTGAELRTLTEEIYREEIVARALSTAIDIPSLRLDSTGLVVLSGQALGTT